MSSYNTINARNTANAPQTPLQTQTAAFSHYNNLSAQLPLDPKSSSLVPGGAGEQARQCLNNIKTIVESIGHVMDDVVKISVFLRSISDIEAVDEAYSAFFPSYVPARTTVAVEDLPMGALVQIEALVSNGEGTIPGSPQAGDLVKVSRNTGDAPRDPRSTRTVAFSHYNNISAQLPIDPRSGKLVAGGARDRPNSA